MVRCAMWFASLCLAVWAVTTTACSTGEDEEPVITPPSLAAQQCATVVQCSCGPTTNDVEFCTEALAENFAQISNAADAANLEYDADCAARQVAWIEELGCTIQNDELLAGASCALDCPLYHGYDGPGEACQVIANRATTCAAGLDCVGGVCQDICNNWRLAEGATCYDAANPPTGTCVSGAHCDVGGTDRCIPTPARGEPCPTSVCLANDFCNQSAQPEPTCEPIGDVGEPCLTDTACKTGYCTSNQCAPLPGIGESCSLECGGDLFCQGGTCRVKQQFGQTCAFDLPCAEGLVCSGGTCDTGQPLVCFGIF